MLPGDRKPGCCVAPGTIAIAPGMGPFQERAKAWQNPSVKQWPIPLISFKVFRIGSIERRSRESAPDPQLRDLLAKAGHVWGDEKLGLPLISMIANGLAMGQYYRMARRQNRKPARPREAAKPSSALPAMRRASRDRLLFPGRNVKMSASVTQPTWRKTRGEYHEYYGCRG